ncbi:MAG: ribose 1,5-bisphosphate isomerase [Candidatus Verstraetearchaeota archaeon]|nr:ribose 1,5-bisphosphate isomerase [Candidatus Verstraetearchaeota archaeon]
MPSFSKEITKLADDIKTMHIRGAAEIGRVAVDGLSIFASQSKARSPQAYRDQFEGAYQFLLATRPTAVSLPNALRYVRHRVDTAFKKGMDVGELRALTIRAAEDFKRSSLEAVKKIGEIGSKRIKNGDLVMTHCNSSVAIATLIQAKREGKDFSVIVTETRPRFQGRLTAKALADKGIPVTLIIDSAARYFMPKVDKVIVGADVVTANGAIVNKIGTSQIALIAKEARVRVFVGAETYKFSPSTVLGELVEIEERPADEVIPKKELKNLKGVRVVNPSFDITPPDLIDVIITERGVIPPQAAILILMEEFGWSIGEEQVGKTLVEEEDW